MSKEFHIPPHDILVMSVAAALSFGAAILYGERAGIESLETRMIVGAMVGAILAFLYGVFSHRTSVKEMEDDRRYNSEQLVKRWIASAPDAAEKKRREAMASSDFKAAMSAAGIAVASAVFAKSQQSRSDGDTVPMHARSDEPLPPWESSPPDSGMTELKPVAMPATNVDGIPMVPGSGLDVTGKPYGVTDSTMPVFNSAANTWAVPGAAYESPFGMNDALGMSSASGFDHGMGVGASAFDHSPSMFDSGSSIGSSFDSGSGFDSSRGY